MRRLANSLAMAGASWRILQDDKRLMAIPVMSLITTVALVGLGGGAVYFSLDRHVAPAGATSLSPNGVTYAIGAVSYLLVTFAVTFFAAALVAGARQHLAGGRPDLGAALSAASSRLPELALWSLLTGTVGLVLNVVQSRSGVVGQIVTRFVGMSWQIVTWLAVPVIVAEGTGPMTSLRRSAGLFRSTWGENLVGQLGFGLVGLLAVVPGLVIAGLVAVTMPVMGVIVGALWLGATSVVLSTMTGIFRTVLYQYAAGAPIPDGFAATDLAAAFGPRGSRRG
jgi:hypothetical protein